MVIKNDAGFVCLPHCDCSMVDGAGSKADCSFRKLTSVPNAAKYEINILSLDYNRIATLKSGDFQGFDALLELTLSGNRLGLIGSGAFNGLRRVTVLDLSSNFLKIVPSSELRVLSANIKWLSLSQNALQYVPREIRNMLNLRYLDLSNNNFITKIPTDFFPSQLISLNLSHTSVEIFQEEHFRNNYALENLHLNDNLASSYVSFGPKTFDSLISLECLDLSRTYCRTVTSNAFENLTNLTTLLMQSSYFTEMPWFSRKAHTLRMKQSRREKRSADETPALLSPTLSRSPSAWYNPKLQFLDMSSNEIALKNLPKKCLPPSLRHLDLSYNTVGGSISNGTFSNLSKLKNLKLVSTNIENIDLGAFQGMDMLQNISVSYNPFNDEPAFPRSITELNMKHHHIRSLTTDRLGALENVRSIDFSYGELKAIEPGVFENMPLLRYLNLTRNVISIIEEKTFSIQSKSHSSILEVLDVSLNLVLNVDNYAFVTLSSLKTLKLNGNQLSALQPYAFNGLRSLTLLDLSENRISTTSPYSFLELDSIEEIQLQRNRLTSLHKNMFSALPHLKSLLLYENSLVNMKEQYFSSLKSLSLDYNLLLSFPRLNATSLTSISLSNNELEDLDGMKQSTLPALKKLNLAVNTYLSVQTYDIFQTVPLLEYLNLNDAGDITQISDFNQPNLRVLLMMGCQITSVDFSLPHLEVIDLSMNNLTNLDPKPFKDSHALQDVNLRGNHFHCDCGIVPLVRWIEEVYYTINVVGADTYMCETPDFLYTEFLSDIVEYMNCTDETGPVSQGSSSTLVAGLITGLVLFSVLVVVGALCFQRSKSSHSGSSNSLEGSCFSLDYMPCRKSRTPNRTASVEVEEQELMTI